VASKESQRRVRALEGDCEGEGEGFARRDGIYGD